MRDWMVTCAQEVFAVLGSLVALLFVDASWCRKMAYFFGGWALSKLFGESVQGLIGTSAETARALTALFGITIVEKLFDIVHGVDTRKIAQTITGAVIKLIGR